MQAARDAEPALIKATSLLGPDGRPVPVPVAVPVAAHFVFATVHVGDAGDAAIAVFAQHPALKPELVLLDYRLRHIDASIFTTAESMILKWLPKFRARPFTTVRAPPPLIATPPHPALVELERPSVDWLGDPEALALVASIHAADGRVRLGETAAAAGAELALALEIRLSNALDPAIPLRGALPLGVKVAFG